MRISVAILIASAFPFLLFPSSLASEPKDPPSKSNETSDTRVSRADASEAAGRALKYLRDEGNEWIEKRKCVSCHQIPAMVWSLSAAKSKGLEVDEAKLTDLQNWSTDFLHFVEPKDRETAEVGDVLSKNIDTMAALLVGLNDYASPAAWQKQFVEKLEDEQLEDGSWPPKGQLPAQKRELKETQQATTLWVTLALLQQESKNFKLDAALEFAGLNSDTEKSTQAQSTEVLVARLLVALELEQNSTSHDIAEELATSQNEDGGWGWLIRDDSDALATGLALYALQTSGLSNQTTLDSARNFLVTTQTAKGNWKTPGTKKNSKNRPTPTANYWGTAWAVIGLTAE